MRRRARAAALALAALLVTAAALQAQRPRYRTVFYLAPLWAAGLTGSVVHRWGVDMDVVAAGKLDVVLEAATTAAGSVCTADPADECGFSVALGARHWLGTRSTTIAPHLTGLAGFNGGGHKGGWFLRGAAGVDLRPVGRLAVWSAAELTLSTAGRTGLGIAAGARVALGETR